MGLELTTDRYPLITNQTCYPLRQACSLWERYQYLKNSNFIHFTTIKKQVHYTTSTKSCLLAPMFMWTSSGRKREYLEETRLSDCVTTWPSHMQHRSLRLWSVKMCWSSKNIWNSILTKEQNIFRTSKSWLVFCNLCACLMYNWKCGILEPHKKHGLKLTLLGVQYNLSWLLFTNAIKAG